MLLLTGCIPIAVPIPSGPRTTEPPPIAALEADLHERINVYRSSRNLPALHLDPFLSSLARGHSERMASRQRSFGHAGIEERVEAARDSLGVGIFSENVARNNYSPDRVVDSAVSGWVSSSGHLQNLTGDYDLTGVGIARASDGTYFITQIYASGMVSDHHPDRT
ncbi:MAG TPA: CAP domain-containing protein [Longimicrobiaceae bacterium]|nr:CAP domain-containing protein [Longimicrobiaceae bacterium]